MTQFKQTNAVEPLITSPKGACTMLDIGPTKLWELINAGEVESYLDGPRRKIIIASIRQYVERRRGKPAPERKGVRARRDQVSAKF